MSSARQEGIASGGRALHEPQAVARLLVSTRVLAWLTTSPWCNDPPLTDPVASYLRTLRSEGWMIREASPRNFVIWRGETLYGRRRKLLVLPNRGVRLRPLERSAVAAALLAPTILRAVDGAPGEGGRKHADRFACRLGFPAGTVELRAHLTVADRKILAALAPSWAYLPGRRC